MSRGWTTKGKFQVGLTKRAPLRKKAQVQIGPEEFPPPSEEEIQTQIDQIEEAAGLIDKVAGFDATLKARFGQEYVDYIQKVSDGLHYLLLQGRRPGPPPGFEAMAPEVERGLGGPGGPGGPGAPGAPGVPGGPGRPEPGVGSPERLPTPAVAMRQPVLQSVAKLDEAVADFENLVSESLEDIGQSMRQAGHDPDSAYLLDETADQARVAVDTIKGALLEDAADN